MVLCNGYQKNGGTLIGSVLFIYELQKRDGQRFTCEVHRNGKNLQNYKKGAKITFNPQTVQLERQIIPKSYFVGQAVSESCDLEGSQESVNFFRFESRIAIMLEVLNFPLQT